MSDSDGQRSADDLHHHGADDTIEIRRDPSLTDDLLHLDDGAGSVSTWVEPAEDDEDYYEPPKKRSRVTTGLVVALIFLLGMFTGVTLSRLLPAQQRPQIVYLLNDDGAPRGPSGMPSGPSAGGPPGAPSGR